MQTKGPFTWIQESPELQALLHDSLIGEVDHSWEDEPDYGDAIAMARQVFPELSFLSDLVLYTFVEEACMSCGDNDWMCSLDDRPTFGTYALARIALPPGTPLIAVAMPGSRGYKVGKFLEQQLNLTGSVEKALQVTRASLPKLMR